MSELKTVPAARHFVSGPGEGERIWFTNAAMSIKATAALTGGDLTLIEVTAPVGHGPPLHVQHDEHESFYVLEGAIEVECDGRRTLAEAGSLVFLPRGVAHAFKVVGDRPVRFLNISVPGGDEGFFRAAGRPAEGPGLPPPAPVDVAALKDAAARFNSEIVGPPLP